MAAEPDVPPPPAAPRPRGRRPHARGSRFELVVGASAILVSLVSLFVAIGANRTRERMLAASMALAAVQHQQYRARRFAPARHRPAQPRHRPARVRWLEMYYRDAPLADWRALRQHCCVSSPTRVDDVYGFTSGVQNRVLGANERLRMLQIRREGTPEPVWNALDAERQNIRMRARECPVLDDCRVFDSAREDPAPVARCPAPGPVLWRA